MAIIATMLITSSLVDEARRFVSELDSVWLWSVSFLSLAYAVFDTKDTWDEIKAAKKIWKSLPCLKLLLLWTIPIVGVLAAWSAEANASSAQEELRQFNVKIETMRGENAKLMEVGERAKESAARARESEEKAKTERERAESGRLELQAKLVELETAQNERQITPEQRKQFVDSLQSETNKEAVLVICSSATRETRRLAQQVRTMLNASGFGSDKISLMDFGTMYGSEGGGVLESALTINFSGDGDKSWVLVAYNSSSMPRNVFPLLQAFADAGIRSEPMAFNNLKPEKVAVIVLGKKGF